MSIADEMFKNLGYSHNKRYERCGYDDYVEFDIYTRQWRDDNIENIKIAYRYCKTNKTDFDYKELKAILQKMRENMEEYNEEE